MADSTSLRRSTDVMCVAPRHERDALIDVVTGTPGGFGLLPALQRLDALLTRAADAAAEIYGPEAATDPYRGLVIGPDEFARLLRRDPGEPLFSADDPDADPPAVRGRELAWIGRAFDLTPFDLNLLCGSAGERIEARSRVAADAPLLRHRLLHLVVDPNQPHQPLLARAMKVDEQVLRLTLGESTLDPRLASCAELAPARRPLASLTLDPAIRRALPLRAIRAVPQSPQPRLYFHGPPGAGQRAAAEALATEARLPLLVVDLDRAGRSETPAEEIIRIAFREAWFRRSAIFLTGADALRDEPGRVARERLLEEISTSRVLTVLAGREAWAPSAHVLDRPTGVAVVPFPVPDVATRRESWERALTAAGIDVDGEVVATLAVHHRLTVSRIAEAVSSVRKRVFVAAESANAVLFFDEADAIFGKRSEVRDAHDRYANIEIAYLLQRMEQYDGIAILATNLRENLDDAFLRRLHFIIEFPMPDAAHRERMWRQFLPTEAPVDGSIDYSFLARQFRLAGGNIKNIVLSAAFLAAASGDRIGMPHLFRATWREHQKMGRVLSEVDIGDYASVLHRGGEP